MYNHLHGKVIKVLPGKIIMETSGIGWDIAAPLSTTAKLQSGKEITLLVHLVVREDAMLLYGFNTEDERALFRTLIGLSGVGAATAVQILSSASPQDFILAIEKQDTSFLKKIKGIGEKTAKRIILELKGAKTMLPDTDTEGVHQIGGIGADAVMALETMGVPAKEAAARVEKVLAGSPSATLEEIVRQALQG